MDTKTALADTGAQLRKITLGTAAAGAVFAVLFVASMVVLARAPGPRASDEEVLAFYAGEGRSWLFSVGLYVLPFSAVAFLWFISALREWVRDSARRLDQVLSNVQLLSGGAFITLALAASAATTVATFEARISNLALDTAAARDLPLYGNALFYVFAMRMAAIFVTATTGILHRSGVFPRWFHLLSYIVAACLFLTASRGLWLALVFPAWVLLLSFMIAFRQRTLASTGA